MANPRELSQLAIYSVEDDLVIALQEATKVMQGERFDLVASANSDVEAARRVTQVADVYIAWLRRVKSIRLTLVAIENPDGELFATTSGGTLTTIADGGAGSVARYVIDAKDLRGVDVDATLAVKVDAAGQAFVTAAITEASAGTASGKDELVVTGLLPGSALVTVFDPANEATVFGSDSVDVTPGGVATITLGAATIEDPAPTA